MFADNGHGGEANRALCRAFDAGPYAHERGRPHGSGLGRRRWPVERGGTRVPENERSAPYHDRLGFIVQALLQTACTRVVAECLARRRTLSLDSLHHPV